jgi:hypothetical protein
MSDTGKQSPLGINLLGSLTLPSDDLRAPIQINEVVTDFIGASKEYSSYEIDPTINPPDPTMLLKGSLVTDTVLNKLTDAINEAYKKLPVDPNNPLPSDISYETYYDLITIGTTTIPALGNTPPATYVSPPNTNPGSPESINTPWIWKKNPTTLPPGEYTQWGWARMYALQAWNEFNWNGLQTASSVEYKNFCTSFSQITSFIQATNATINSVTNGESFAEGSFSNMNDMLTGDITGVSLSTVQFGQDLIALGKSLTLSTIASFGLPSNLLKTINECNGISQSLSLALIASGMTPTDLENIFNSTATVAQEQKIYGAFLIITGQDLRDVCVTLNCKISNLNSLADLLNVKKLLPNSYTSLTVPYYNTTVVPSNSKTYYLIYENEGVSPRLSSASIVQQVGVIIPPGPPPIQTEETLGVIQELRPGFDSYLTNILPTDQAIAAGAFGISMQQIKNITQMPIEKFAQVVSNLETVRGLNLLQGTTTPVDPELAGLASSTISNGTGPNGGYTMSDFFGCMSGLPYAWRDIQRLIQELQTPKLQQIYQDIYDAVLIYPTPTSPTLEELIIEANEEIENIQINNPEKAKILNTLWSATGTQLTAEQTARQTALQPVPVPQDNELGVSPDAQISFVDNVPEWAKSTLPHMQAQTLEAIANWNSIGGQSLVGMMREERNKERLQQLGIPPDDNIDDDIPPKQQQILLSNGTSPTAKLGIEVPGVGCDINANTIFTIPSSLQIKNDNVTIIPSPFGYFNPNDEQYYVTNQTIGGQGGTTTLGEYTVLGSLQPLLINNTNGNVLGPYCDGTGPDGANTIQPIKVGAKISTGIGNPVDTGNPVEPGSLAGSQFKDTIPDNLNLVYTSGLLSPATYNTDDAVEEVIRCNCDCWLE